MAATRQCAIDARRVVVKIGSALLSAGGRKDRQFQKFANEFVACRDSGRDLVVVSSGAVAEGVGLMGFSERPAGLSIKQGLAAVGQPAVMQKWSQAMAPTPVAQFLLSKFDVTNPTAFLNARRALRALRATDVIPIGNENDTVSTDRIKIGDNDNLAAYVAHVANADLLVILTQVDGLYTGNPEKDSSAKLLSNVSYEELTKVAGFCDGVGGDGLGTGGFDTKIEAVHTAFEHGIPVIIANGFHRNILARVLDGEDVGTLFLPPKDMPRKHWLQHRWPVQGSITLSAEATERFIAESATGTLCNIWMEDAKDVSGVFYRGAAVGLSSSNGKCLGRGLIGYNSADIEEMKGAPTPDVLESLGAGHFDGPLFDGEDTVLYPNF